MKYSLFCLFFFLHIHIVRVVLFPSINFFDYKGKIYFGKSLFAIDNFKKTFSDFE
jgi:hypothetical protein